MTDRIAPKSYTIAQITEVCGGTFNGPPDDAQRPIRGVQTLVDSGSDEVTWLVEDKHLRSLDDCKAAAVIGREDHLGGHPRAILVKDPALAVALVLDLFHRPASAPKPGVHPSAVADPTAVIGENVAIGACAVIGPGARIGKNTVICPGVSIGADVAIGENCRIFDRCVVYDRCTLGNRVILNAGTVIGADGFGYIFRDGAHRKLAHIGTVLIEDDVEIGANSCVDRAKIGATIIGRGTKIDNLVQVAHNVRVGPLCVIAAQTGISGSCRLGTGVAVGGQAGIADGVDIGDGARLGAQSGSIGNIKAGMSVFGTPARDSKEVFKNDARVRRLAALFENVAELEKRLAQLEAATHHPERG